MVEFCQLSVKPHPDSDFQKRKVSGFLLLSKRGKRKETSVKQGSLRASYLDSLHHIVIGLCQCACVCGGGRSVSQINILHRHSILKGPIKERHKSDLFLTLKIEEF